MGISMNTEKIIAHKNGQILLTLPKIVEYKGNTKAKITSSKNLLAHQHVPSICGLSVCKYGTVQFSSVQFCTLLPIVQCIQYNILNSVQLTVGNKSRIQCRAVQCSGVQLQYSWTQSSVHPACTNRCSLFVSTAL